MKQQGVGMRKLFAGIMLLCASTACAQNIKVKNGITKKMLGYRILIGTFRPTQFKLTVNGTVIEQDQEKTVSAHDGKLNVRYDYEFQNGRKGAKVVTLAASKDMTEATVKFKWKNKWRILIDGAKAESVKEL